MPPIVVNRRAPGGIAVLGGTALMFDGVVTFSAEH